MFNKETNKQINKAKKNRCLFISKYKYRYGGIIEHLFKQCIK